jgi:small subunit ribosomal protein S17
MPDENEKGASADAEAPNEESEIVELTSGPEAVEPAAEAEADESVELVAEAEPVEDAASEPVVEAAADVPEADDVPRTESAEAATSIGASSSAKPKKKRLPRSLRPQRARTKREQPKERKPITRLPKPEHARGRRQERQGTVVSSAADKTIVVRVDVAKAHPMYKKVIRRSTRLHAHDEQNQAKVGDVVLIVETRPLSRMKRWRLQEIVEAAK